MEINQSLMKRVSGSYCPKKVKAELDGIHKREASYAMICGQYFEYQLFGTKNREGQIPVMPRKRNGEMKIDQIRIDKQVARFRHICEKNDIVIYGHDRTFHVDMFGFKTFGTWDAYGLYKGKPVVIDIKLTKDVTNDFGDFSWGDFDTMDHIQANKYMEAGKRLDGIKYDFLFMVFDYKPVQEHRLLFVPYTEDVPLIVHERIQETVLKLKINKDQGWPAVGLPEECARQVNGKPVYNCPFASVCPKFVTKSEMKQKWRKIRMERSLETEDLDKARAEVDDVLAGVFNS